MLTAIIIVMIVCSFLLGRLTVFPQNKKFKKLESELAAMTESRNKWRYKYLALVMREKLKEKKGKHGVQPD